MRVNCPTCKREIEWSATGNPWRPFCSERCRLIDLGAWLSGERAIAGAPADEMASSGEPGSNAPRDGEG